jgi:hypothetical protein
MRQAARLFEAPRGGLQFAVAQGLQEAAGEHDARARAPRQAAVREVIDPPRKRAAHLLGETAGAEVDGP